MSQYTELVLSFVFIAWGNWRKRLCHNLQDQYRCVVVEEMQADTILGQSAGLEIQTVSTVPEAKRWPEKMCTVRHFLLIVPVHRRCTGFCSGRPIQVLDKMVFGVKYCFSTSEYIISRQLVMLYLGALSCSRLISEHFSTAYSFLRDVKSAPLGTW